MEREGVGRVGLANLCFSDKDQLESVFGGGISTSTADYTRRQIKTNNQIVQHALQELQKVHGRIKENR